MATTYALKITQLDVLPKVGDVSDVVVCAYWAYSGTTEEGRVAAFGGSTPITYVADASFVPFNVLTEADVLAWIMATWSQEEANGYKAAIDAQLDILSPSMPWGAIPPEPAVA